MKRGFMMFLTIVLLSGCGFGNQANEPDREGNLVRVKNSTIENIDRKTGQDISKHLVELATSIPNVNDATAVVLGKYAIVGIDVDDQIERSEVGTIKYSVAESLKNDPYGARAVVIADPDMTARLKEISQDIQDGKPIRGVMNELSDITGRMMPEVPADMIDPKPKNGTEKPKKQLNDKQDKNLEKQQEKQSNYHKD